MFIFLTILNFILLFFLGWFFSECRMFYINNNADPRDEDMEIIRRIYRLETETDYFFFASPIFIIGSIFYLFYLSIYLKAFIVSGLIVPCIWIVCRSLYFITRKLK